LKITGRSWEDHAGDPGRSFGEGEGEWRSSGKRESAVEWTGELTQEFERKMEYQKILGESWGRREEGGGEIRG